MVDHIVVDSVEGEFRRSLMSRESVIIRPVSAFGGSSEMRVRRT